MDLKTARQSLSEQSADEGAQLKALVRGEIDGRAFTVEAVVTQIRTENSRKLHGGQVVWVEAEVRS